MQKQEQEEKKEQEKRLKYFYENYSRLYFANPGAVKAQNDQWTRDGTKERTWVAIYNKEPIPAHLDKLLFTQPFDEAQLVSEMDSFVIK
jgi:hypothetical protein